MNAYILLLYRRTLVEIKDDVAKHVFVLGIDAVGLCVGVLCLLLVILCGVGLPVFKLFCHHHETLVSHFFCAARSFVFLLCCNGVVPSCLYLFVLILLRQIELHTLSLVVDLSHADIIASLEVVEDRNT